MMGIIEIMQNIRNEKQVKCDRLEKENERLVEIITEMSIIIKNQAENDYPIDSRDKYPSYQRKYERDIQIIENAKNRG